MSKQHRSDMEALRRLTGQLRFFQALSAAALVACATLGFLFYREITIHRQELIRRPYIQAGAPAAELVENTIKRLRYSGFEALTRSGVSLSADFGARTWTLHGLHRFDAQGRIVLDEIDKFRYGVCHELAIYAYQQIRPSLDPERYAIDFIEAYESSYFQNETGGRHVVLRVIDLASAGEENQFRSVFILDPALRRYGSPEHFKDYQIIEKIPTEAFLKARDEDSSFVVNAGPPIVITRDAFVSLYVTENGGKFDARHHRVVLSAVRRYQFAREELFVIEAVDGKVTIVDGGAAIHKFMDAKRFGKLREAVIRLYRDAAAREFAAR